MIELNETHYHERAVLGSVLVNPNCFSEVRDTITSIDCFTEPLNAVVFKAMDEAYSQHGKLDEVLLFDRILATSGSSVVPHLSTLVASVPTSANIRQYTDLVFSAYQRRIIARDAKALAQFAESRLSTDEDIEGRVNQIVEVVSASARADEKPKSIADMAVAAADRLCDRIENRGLSGLKTGIGPLDKLTHGLSPGMHVVAACTSVGKTALALNIARNVCRNGGCVLFISLEMGADELVDRMLMMVGGIDGGKLNSGFLARAEAQKIPVAVEELARMDLRIVKPPSVTPAKLRAIVANQCIAKKPSLIVLDYIQLMSGDSSKDSRQVEVAACSRAIKLVSGEFCVPIIALSQLNREAADGVPKLHHLRESGAIEQDADTVLMLHREDNAPDALLAVLRKGRSVGVGSFKLHYNKATQVISEFGGVPDSDRGSQQQPVENWYNDEDEEDF